MQTASPPLLPLFRSRSLALILAYLFIRPDGRVSLSALGQTLGIATSTVQREVDRLETAGIVISERVGNVRLVRANRDSPYFADLQSLLLKAFGPAAVLGELLREIEGVTDAYIFGSWAARYLDQPGPAPEDIDVLVIGDPDPDEVFGASSQAADRLGREVNPTIVAAETWRESEAGFIRTVRSRPLVPIPLEDEQQLD